MPLIPTDSRLVPTSGDGTGLIRSYYDPDAISKVLDGIGLGVLDHLDFLQQTMMINSNDPKLLSLRLRAGKEYRELVRQLLKDMGLLVDAKATRVVKNSDGTTVRQTVTTSRLLSKVPDSSASPAAASKMRESYQKPENS